MRTQATFQAWLQHAKKKQRLFVIAVETGDYSEVEKLDAEGQRLWDVAFDDGWTQEEGLRALKEMATAR